MLYLHRFCYSVVSFAIFWWSEFIKQVGFSVIFALFVLERFTSDLSSFFELTTSLKSIVTGKCQQFSCHRN